MWSSGQIHRGQDSMMSAQDSISSEKGKCCSVRLIFGVPRRQVLCARAEVGHLLGSVSESAETLTIPHAKRNGIWTIGPTDNLIGPRSLVGCHGRSVPWIIGTMCRGVPGGGGGGEGGLPPPSTQTYTGRPKLKL